VGRDSDQPRRPGRAGLSVIAFVILCIAFDALEHVWVEWKRMLWGEMAMAVREKLALTRNRMFSRRSS